ncbi:MAG: hypothetical protein ACXVZN_13695 [Gaiellaceae bacterium]
MHDLWIPGAQQPSMDEFVDRIHRQVKRFAEEHGVEEASMEVELYDGAVFHVRSLSPEPGFGFVTLRPYDDGDPGAGIVTELIVPVATLRRITLAASGAPHPRFGFSLPAPS